MTYQIPSYWKSANIGDPKLVEFFSGENEYIIEEKLDGSQFSFAKINGELVARSRGKQLEVTAPEKMFKKAVDAVMELSIPENVIFRGEAITSEQHNTLKYSRTPRHYFAIFGAECALSGEIYSRPELEDLCAKCHMEITPLVATAKGPGIEVVRGLNGMLARESMLGGALVEGLVVKRVGGQVYFMDRPVFAKLVSEAFREQHRGAWAATNPQKLDILQQLVTDLSGPARFSKAVHHLRDEGKITDSVKDIGLIIAEVKRDVVEEGEAYAKEVLWNWAKDKLARGAGNQVPSWYKEQLTKSLENALEKIS